MVDGPQRARLLIPPTATLSSCLWSQRTFPSLPGSRLNDFLSRCKFSTLTTRQPMVEFYLLTFSRFPLQKKEKKLWFPQQSNSRLPHYCSRCTSLRTINRPLGRKSRSWSQRDRKINGSYHGDSSLLKPTGIQIVTISLPGPTFQILWKLIRVKTMPFGHITELLLSGVLPAIYLNYKLQEHCRATHLEISYKMTQEVSELLGAYTKTRYTTLYKERRRPKWLKDPSIHFTPYRAQPRLTRIAVAYTHGQRS